MQILSGSLEVTMTKQNLDGAQVRASLQQVCGPTVTQSMWGDSFLQSSVPSRLLAREPDAFVRDGLFRSAPRIATGKQVSFRLAPTPVFPQRFEQRWTERQVTAAPPFAAIHSDHHPLAIDVVNLETSKFRAPHASAVEGYQQRPPK